jgi:hypothetical protein
MDTSKKPSKTFQENKGSSDGLYITPSRGVDPTGKYLSGVSREGKVEWTSFEDTLEIEQLRNVIITKPKCSQSLLMNDDGQWSNGFVSFASCTDVDVEDASPNSSLVWTGSKWKAMPFSNTGIKSINGESSVFHSFSTGRDGKDTNIVSINGNHQFNIPNASATTRGSLTNSDWTKFNIKLSPYIRTGFMYIGNADNIAEPTEMKGDAKMSADGVLSLVPTGVVPGQYTNCTLTVDKEGRVTGAVSNEVKKEDTLITISDNRVQINGCMSEDFTVKVGSSGTDVTVDSLGEVIVVNIPLSSSNTTGKLSYDDWNKFNSKLDGTLPTGYIYMGNYQGIAQCRKIKGDGSISSGGIFSLEDTDVVPGSYKDAIITVDSKGRITSIYETGTPSLRIVSGSYSNPKITVDEQGSIISLVEGPTPTFDGIKSVNEQTGPHLSISTGEGGKCVDVVNIAGSITIHIPVASGSVSGKISSKDWNTFNNKMGTSLPEGEIIIGGIDCTARSVLPTGDMTIDTNGVTKLATVIVPQSTFAATVTVDHAGRVVKTESSISEGTPNGSVLVYSGNKLDGCSKFSFIDDVLYLGSTVRLSGGRCDIVAPLALSISSGENILFKSDVLSFQSENTIIKLDKNSFNIGGGAYDSGVSTITGTDVSPESSGDIVISGGLSDCSMDGGSIVIQSGSASNPDHVDGSVFIDCGGGEFVSIFLDQNSKKSIVYPSFAPIVEGSLMAVESIYGDIIKLGWNSDCISSPQGIVFNDGGILTSASAITSSVDGYINLLGLGSTSNLKFTAHGDISMSPQGGFSVKTEKVIDLLGLGGAMMCLDGGITLSCGKNKIGCGSVVIQGCDSNGDIKVQNGGDVFIGGGDMDVEGRTRRAGSIRIVAGSNKTDGSNGDVIIESPSCGMGPSGSIGFISGGIEYKLPSVCQPPRVNRPLCSVGIKGGVVQLGFPSQSYLMCGLDTDTHVKKGSVLEFNKIISSSGIKVSSGVFTLLPDKLYKIDATFVVKEKKSITICCPGIKVSCVGGIGVYHGVYDTYDSTELSFSFVSIDTSFLLIAEFSHVTIVQLN